MPMNKYPLPEIPDPVYWPSNTRILADTYWHMQDIADMQSPGSWNPAGTTPMYFAIEQLAKPRDVRETVTTEDSGGYTVKVKFIADNEDSSEAELLTLELPSIVMFEKQKKEAGWYPYYSYASFVLDLHRLTASEQPALRGFDSNSIGIFTMDELKNESVGSIIYQYNADDFNPGIQWGDVNTDGAVDIADAVLLSRYLVSDREAVITSQGLRNSRVTNGEDITTDDVTKILQFTAKKIKAEDLTPERPEHKVVGNPFGPHTDRNPNAGYEDETDDRNPYFSEVHH
ncbi:MAG: dockerin type I repeat-containing protein [Oscillospiraceae bacterium]|nr:dockerin type I repeat-containing protein [Oscillospiraceae bacterium]